MSTINEKDNKPLELLQLATEAVIPVSFPTKGLPSPGSLKLRVRLLDHHHPSLKFEIVTLSICCYCKNYS